MKWLVDHVTFSYQGASVDRGFGDELEGDVAVARPRQPVLKNRFAFLEIWIKWFKRNVTERDFLMVMKCFVFFFPDRF